jgi:PAS domain S-box-containing protein
LNVANDAAALGSRVLLLADDAAQLRATLGFAGIATQLCANATALLQELDRGAGAVIVADNVLSAEALDGLAAWLAKQPQWSDMPILWLTSQRAEADEANLERLRNVRVLESPRQQTLLSVTRAALRGRARQYEARRQLEALRQSEARLQLAHQIGNMGDWSWDMATDQLTWSDAMFQLHGLDPGSIEPTMESWMSMVHAEDRELALAEIMIAASGERHFETQLRINWPSGEAHWIQMRGARMSTADGSPHILFGTSADITKLKRAETALALANDTLATAVAERTHELSQSEARFRALFDSAVQLSGLIDLEGRVLIANQTALDAVGITLSDVLNKPLWDSPWIAPTPPEAERLKIEIPRAAAGRLVRYEFKLLFPDGLFHVFDFSMKPVRDNSGAISQIIVEGRDITEIKRTEEALLQAQKMDVLGQITGGVAHDFNNLLMAVMANLDLLEKHVRGDPRSEHLIDGAMQGARRGATLTQRLLSFARKQELHAEPVDLVMLLAGMKDLLGRSAGPLVEIVIDAKQTLPAAHVDPHQLELAILNLAVNARDAMPKGGTITIAIDVVQPAEISKSELEPGDYLCLTVSDTGIGMDSATLARAIEPFFSTKEIGKGTGLGLSMAHGLAVQSGGNFRLSSIVGNGTTAEMWLPASDRQPAAAEQPKVMERKTEPITILVVDDDALIAMSTADMLQELGHNVIEAYSGARALEILRDGQNVQLMITDYAMPGMTGLQLARSARELKPDLPVLLATGYADLPDGATSELPRLAKPFMQDQLATQIAKVFGH